MLCRIVACARSRPFTEGHGIATITGQSLPSTTPTKNPHELDEISTAGGRSKLYPGLTMRGAFVVQLRKGSQVAAGQMEGSVEEVDTGKQRQFHTEDELIGFLRECFAESCRNASRREGTK